MKTMSSVVVCLKTMSIVEALKFSMKSENKSKSELRTTYEAQIQKIIEDLKNLKYTKEKMAQLRRVILGNERIQGIGEDKHIQDFFNTYEEPKYADAEAQKTPEAAPSTASRGPLRPILRPKVTTDTEPRVVEDTGDAHMKTLEEILLLGKPEPRDLKKSSSDGIGRNL